MSRTGKEGPLSREVQIAEPAQDRTGLGKTGKSWNALRVRDANTAALVLAKGLHLLPLCSQRCPAMTRVQSCLRSPMAGRAPRSPSWCMALSSLTSATLATRWWGPASSCASGT